MQHPVHVRCVVRTALALQYLAHVRLAVRASNHIDTPRLIPCTAKNRDIDLPASTNVNYPHRTSNCTSTTRPTSATRNNRPAVLLQLDRHQLPATIVQLHASTIRPTSATRNDRPAAHIYYSTNIRYSQRLSSCFSSTSTIPATDTNQLIEDTTYHELYALVKTTINCHLCYICYLAFVSFIVFWLSLLTRLIL